MGVPIEIILVPKGAEYQAVCRGLHHVVNPPIVLPVPVGPIPLTQHLQKLQESGQFTHHPAILVTGLCGSLVDRYQVGDIVLYQECVTLGNSAIACNTELTALLQQRGIKADLVKAFTSDRVICLAAEKRSLADQAAVVDMEGYAALEFLTQIGASVATLRVVSDDCHHDLPNLANAFSPDGSLRPLPLAIGMLKQPIAATRLIRGSLQGLNVLQTAIATVFTEKPVLAEQLISPNK